MTFLTGKSLPRRTVLRGLGASLSLPLLDAMLPAFASRARAATTRAHRFLAFYVPNGMAMEYWTPKGEGRDFELSPILEPLAPFRNQMLVLSGINASWNYIHAGASGSFLTGTTRGGRNEVEILADVSMDQLLARHFANETQVASLELVDGRTCQRGRLHRHPELCVHAHDLVAQCHATVADGVQPARGVRASVRRQRQHRPGGARGATAPAEEPARLGQREARQTAAGARRAGSGEGRAVHRSCSRHRAPNPEEPSSRATSSCRRWSSRRACRRCSRITWRSCSTCSCSRSSPTSHASSPS